MWNPLFFHPWVNIKSCCSLQICVVCDMNYLLWILNSLLWVLDIQHGGYSFMNLSFVIRAFHFFHNSFFLVFCILLALFSVLIFTYLWHCITVLLSELPLACLIVGFASISFCALTLLLSILLLIFVRLLLLQSICKLFAHRSWLIRVSRCRVSFWCRLNWVRWSIVVVDGEVHVFLKNALLPDRLSFFELNQQLLVGVSILRHLKVEVVSCCRPVLRHLDHNLDHIAKCGISDAP